MSPALSSFDGQKPGVHGKHKVNMNYLKNCQSRYRSNPLMGRTRTGSPDGFKPSKFDCTLKICVQPISRARDLGPQTLYMQEVKALMRLHVSTSSSESKLLIYVISTEISCHCAGAIKLELFLNLMYCIRINIVLDLESSLNIYQMTICLKELSDYSLGYLPKEFGLKL